ncbi:hypothetical protein EGI16_14275 [Chryseobacterium sp. G0240]|uniref:hypothetical protein n=1 Tax=Chryseobacterium sp. G0240 TaxID=2487066 RepID=UPI000F45CF65|nr:hypothetical protein [Chryseobacterium sp. G0240]ROI02052.1 hypothetical protein EGI16_14275 [Chryseobacterium sp. G0240]
METTELKKTEYGTEAIGNKLEKLVLKDNKRETNLFIEQHVEHDIGVMFTFKAKDGILKDCFGITPKSSKLYLSNYLVDISVFKELYEKYSNEGKGLQFDFVFITAEEYTYHTGNTNISTDANAFLYFIATPINNKDALIDEHYVIFNLNHRFEIGKDFIDNQILAKLVDRYKMKDVFTNMSTYSSPIKPTECIYYTWEDIYNIINKRNISNKLYKELQFSLGEVIKFDIISEYFSDNPYFKFEEVKYKAAYLDHEKRLTILGRYLPDDMSRKEGFFDMGSLYP